MSNFKLIHRLTLNCKKEVKPTQKQPSCEKAVWPLKAWVKKVGKSKVAAKNSFNDVNANKLLTVTRMAAMMLMIINFNSNCYGIIVKIYYN